MKISKIEARNFLGARKINADIGTPIAIFCGANGSGKSSVQESVRMALTGESVRVALKKDYAGLVTDGEKLGLACVTLADGPRYAVELPGGKGTPNSDPALPYVLDAQRFARLDLKARRTFLFNLMNVRVTADNIRERLIATYNCRPELIDEIVPTFNAGFEPAAAEAQGKAREAKGAWKQITGETYGEKKAETWAAPVVEFDRAAFAAARVEFEAVGGRLEDAATKLGGMQAQVEHVATLAGRLESLRAEAGQYARIATKLATDERDLAQQAAIVAETREAAAGGPSDIATPCPECGAALVIKGPVLKSYSPPAKEADREAVARLPAQEDALAMLARTVENDKRDLAAADAAGKLLAELGKTAQAAPSDEDIEQARANLAALKTRRADLDAQMRIMEDAEKAASAAASNTARAADAHRAVLDWSRIADALAPDGIPGDLLAEALGPINDRMAASALLSGWARVDIRGDMGITMGRRDYALLSESEQWRADAMIAEAIAHVSGLRLLVLDRFDVLDLRGRGELLGWLSDLAERDELDTALLFGTMKAAPTGLPETITAFWLSDGILSAGGVA